MYSANVRALEMKVHGFLSEEVLQRLLAPIDAALKSNPSDPCTLLIDILGMQGYSPEARAAYVGWHRRSPSNLCGVAVVTTNRLWQMVIAAIGITVPLRAFDGRERAEQWLRDLGARTRAASARP
jgi:hypothetical protein